MFSTQIAFDRIAAGYLRFTVSTVKLAARSEGKWFETMIFDEDGDSVWVDRYDTAREALAGHDWVMANWVP